MEHTKNIIANMHIEQNLENNPRFLHPVKPSVPACQKCKDVGHVRADVPYGHPLFGKAQPCECTLRERKRRLSIRLMEESGIFGMKRYKNEDFSTFDSDQPGTSKAYTEAIKFAQRPSGWLFLVGSTGCGKTHLAVAIAKERIEAGNTVLIETVPTLLSDLRAAIDDGAKYKEIFHKMIDVDLLVLDDLGAENPTKWVGEKLFDILNTRYNSELPMVITANSLEGIELRLRSRLGDREMVTTVTMDQARDYRLHRQAEQKDNNA